MAIQLATPINDLERHNTQYYRQTDGQTDDIIMPTADCRSPNKISKLTFSRAVMIKSFLDKSDIDLASIDCSCRPVMSVCNIQPTYCYTSDNKLITDRYYPSHCSL